MARSETMRARAARAAHRADLEERMPHTQRVDALLADGNVEEAKRVHTERVEEQFARAEQGETINLSDLMAAKEQIDYGRS